MGSASQAWIVIVNFLLTALEKGDFMCYTFVKHCDQESKQRSEFKEKEAA